MRRTDGRAFQLDLIAFRVIEIDRRSVAFRTVALDGFADRYAERRKSRDDGVTVERFDAKAEMIHVGRRTRRCLALFDRDKVEQRGAGTHLDQADAVQLALDLEAQRLLVEPDHCSLVTDP